MILRLVDRDMFMRFRGGGIGHMYMHQVEPWLDATGWGATWPSLKDRDPDPDFEPPSQENNTGSALTTQGDQAYEGEETSGDEGGGEDTDMSKIEDGDGEDPEQPDDEDTSDDDGDGGQNPNGHTRSRGDGYETEDEDEESFPEFASL